MGRNSFNLEKSAAVVSDVEPNSVKLQGFSAEDGTEVKIEKPKTAADKVGVFALYRYSTSTERFVMFLAVIFAIGQAFMSQTLAIAMANTINDYVEIIQGRNDSAGEGNATMPPPDDRDDILQLAEDVTTFLAILIFGSFILASLYIGIFAQVGELVTRRVRQMAFRNVIRQNIGYFDKHLGGEINTRLAEDTVRFQAGIGEKVGFTVYWVSMFIWALIVCFVRSWQLTLVMLAMVPVAAIISGAVNIIIKRISEKEANLFSLAGAVAEEALSNIRIVAAFAGEDREVERYDMKLEEARKIAIKGSAVTAVSQSISWMIIFVFASVLIYYARILLQDGDIGPGDIAQILQCMVSGFRSLAWAIATLEIISDAQGAAHGIYELIDLESEIDPLSDKGKKLDSLIGKVTFEDIHFRYPAREDVQVLKGLSLTIDPGQTVALVGPSGCGKSTTIQLLQRFYDQQQGTVTVDGHDVRDLNVRWFRQQVGVVSQDPILFATTVEDNIRFGRESATSAEIIECAKEANAHNFIMKLPEGYETVLNEQSTQLSRGEKQRLSLARALVRKPKILLLDECTSALDNESEVIVQAALEKASKGRTTIIIAHRLSTVRDSDCLFVIDKGVVAEKGTHTELLERKQLYHRLVSTQMMEAEEKDELARRLEEEEKDHAFKRANSLTASRRSRSSTYTSQNYEDIEQEELDSDDVKETVSVLQLLSLNSEEKGYLIAGCVLAFIMGIFWPVFAIIFGAALDAFTLGDDEQDEQTRLVNRYATFLLIMAAAAGVVSFSTTFLLRYAGEYMGQRIRRRAFTSMLNQEIGWFDRRSNQVGSLTTRLANDASRVKMATGAPLASMTNAVAAVLASMFVSIYFGWQFGLVMLALMPLQTLGGFMQTYSTNSFALKASKTVEESGKIASEAVDKIRIVQSLSKEDFFMGRYDELFDRLKKAANKRAFIVGLSWGVFNFITGAVYIAALGLGFFFVADDVITFDTIFTILFCVVLSSLEVGRANAYIPEITSARASAAKLFHIFNRESQINPKDPTGITPDDCKGEINFSNINFFYPTRQEIQVLYNFNLEANRGQSIAMVGPSGGGKSSVVQLLERFYDTTTGLVSMDHRDVSSLNIQWLRSQMAIVTQDPVLFSYSIGENIAYGDNKRQIPMDEIISAAKQANIHDFISNLPKGYDTTVGSKGTQLSGGQKQRVSIARALIRNPKILLLDDATSALDTQSEAVVEQALDRARQGRTCIVISHRLSSIVSADLIMYVDKGKVIEKGTHAQLMAKEGFYYKLQKANLGK